MRNITITKWIENFDARMYDSPDVDTQIDAGWFDWFCRDTSLGSKTKKLAPKVKQIAKLLGKKFCDTHYVFFKNNCPMYGKLYDDFRFCDLKTGDVIYTITPNSGYQSDKGEAFLYGNENRFEKPLIKGTWKEVVEYFKNKKNN